MDISMIIKLFGGIALFLFGMKLMGDGLKSVAGNKLELVLFRLSNTIPKGVLLGAGVTAVIQSSSATSVMAVGFVNSGMMKLRQSVGIVLGAILGTSITGWIICLNYIDGASGAASLFSSATLTGLVAAVGIVLCVFVKTQTARRLGEILMGFAVLMYGMSAMSGAVSSLGESEEFRTLLT
ncbi:MAG: Na/Pi symporter, partial [Clostridia bacterium]|nr:Na/Pi symporter [Clostridia bacterium]